VNEDQAPRQNRDGHPCPPWCTTGHGTPVSSLSHWGAAVTIELPGTGRIGARAAHPGSASDRAEVSVTAFRHGGKGEAPDLRLSARDAKYLAAIIDMLDDWDEVRGLVAAIRQAAADITGETGEKP
jgi:hypothetical protein